MSTHVTSIAMKAINTGRIDAIMFPVNPAHDLLSGDAGYGVYFGADSFRPAFGRLPSAHEDRRQLYQACLEKGGFIDGDVPTDMRSAMALSLTEAKCNSHALGQPGVSIALPGCATAEEVKAALSSVSVSPDERDYSAPQGLRSAVSCASRDAQDPAPSSQGWQGSTGTSTRLVEL